MGEVGGWCKGATVSRSEKFGNRLTEDDESLRLSGDEDSSQTFMVKVRLVRTRTKWFCPGPICFSKGKCGIMSKFDEFLVRSASGSIDQRASVAKFSEALRAHAEQAAEDTERFSAVLLDTLRANGGRMNAAHLLAVVSAAESPDTSSWGETSAKASDALDALVAAGEVTRKRGRNGGVSLPGEDEGEPPPAPAAPAAKRGRPRKAA